MQSRRAIALLEGGKFIGQLRWGHRALLSHAEKNAAPVIYEQRARFIRYRDIGEKPLQRSIIKLARTGNPAGCTINLWRESRRERERKRERVFAIWCAMTAWNCLCVYIAQSAWKAELSEFRMTVRLGAWKFITIECELSFFACTWKNNDDFSRGYVFLRSKVRRADYVKMLSLCAL